MIRLKQLSLEYAEQINKFWERDWSDKYSLPDQQTSIIDAVAVNDVDRVIAYGQVKLFPELMLFSDMEASKRERVPALKLLMEEAFRGIDRDGLDAAYCLIKDMKFARMIAKRYGFELIDNPGVLLHRKMV